MQEFRNAIERRDLDGLIALFAEDVVFRSPAVYSPYQGREQARAIFSAVSHVLEDFRYESELESADGAHHALVFRARIGDREVHGCDFVHVDDEGMIDEVFVMIRPLSGLLALGEAMKRQLELAETGEALA